MRCRSWFWTRMEKEPLHSIANIMKIILIYYSHIFQQHCGTLHAITARFEIFEGTRKKPPSITSDSAYDNEDLMRENVFVFANFETFHRFSTDWHQKSAKILKSSLAIRETVSKHSALEGSLRWGDGRWGRAGVQADQVTQQMRHITLNWKDDTFRLYELRETTHMKHNYNITTLNFGVL